jgi:5'-nucleotidase (lipoprotein e(P4) family)
MVAAAEAAAGPEVAHQKEKGRADKSALRPMTAHNNLHALLFQATSAEYIALCVQTYQLARLTILERMAEKSFRNPAVILDLDETILDNSAYQAWQIQAGTNFDETTSWRAWCDCGQAGAVPGAIEFVRYAVNLGVTPIFITSRENVTRRGTVDNLVKLGLLTKAEQGLELRDGATADNANRTRLFMKGMPSIKIAVPLGEQTYDLANKFLQRVFCEQVRKYEIILSVGDNLGDYAEYYGRVVDASGAAIPKAHPTAASRRASVLQDLRLFGRDFVLIPNATYGGWLRAFEANGLGASDELAQTPGPVREGLKEPQESFTFGASQNVKAAGRKFSAGQLRIWEGPKAKK